MQSTYKGILPSGSPASYTSSPGPRIVRTSHFQDRGATTSRTVSDYHTTGPHVASSNENQGYFSSRQEYITVTPGLYSSKKPVLGNPQVFQTFTTGSQRADRNSQQNQDHDQPIGSNTLRSSHQSAYYLHQDNRDQNQKTGSQPSTTPWPATNPMKQSMNSDNDNASMKASHISMEKETVNRGTPKEVSRTHLNRVHRSTRDLQPVLVSISQRENITESESVNLRQIMVDCFKRIVLMGMENDRLLGKNQDLEQVIAGLRAKVTTMEIEVKDFDQLSSECSAYRSKINSLEIKIRELGNSTLKVNVKVLEEYKARVDELEHRLSMYEQTDEELRRNISLMEQDLMGLPNLLQENKDIKRSTEDLKRELESLRKTNIHNSELSRKLTMLSTENDRLQRDHQGCKTQITMLATENERLQRDHQGCNTKITMIAAENERLQALKSEVEGKNHKISTLFSDLDGRNRHNSELSQKLSMLAAENDRLQRDHQGCKTQITMLATENERLQRDHQGCNTKITMIAAENERLQALKSEANRNRDKISMLVTENERLLKTRDDTHSEYKAVIDDLNNQLASMEMSANDHHAVRAQIEHDLTSIHNLLTVKDKQLADADENKRIISSLETEIGKLKDRISQLESILSQTQNDRSNIDADRNRLRDKIYQLEASVSNIDGLNNQIIELKGQLLDRDGDVKRLNGEIELMGDDLTKLQQYSADLAEENAALKEEIQELDGILMNKDIQLQDVENQNKSNLYKISLLENNGDQEKARLQLSGENDKLLLLVRTLEQDISRKSDEIDSLTKSMDDIESQNRELRKNAGLIESEINGARGDIGKMKTDMTR